MVEGKIIWGRGRRERGFGWRPIMRVGLLAQREGFSPLAARPAPTLLTSSFADEFSVVLVLQGKAFRSRKTAPTLESLRIPVRQKNMGRPYRASHIFGAERGIRTPGNSRFNGFQDRRNRPLYHLCIIFIVIIENLSTV